jgi:Mn2+/Fe2+ NRAMP family transporter
VLLAALVIIASAMTGNFRRFERIAMVFCAGSLLLIPVYVLAHPPVGQMARGFVIPAIPGGGQMATVMLMIIGIVGTTVAPWQLFFQQSYVVDKRITPRFIRYERADLVIGIVVVIVGGAAIMGAMTAAFAGTRAAGHFNDTAGLAAGLAAYAGKAAGALFAVALLDAAMIGAFAVSLSTAYALGDILGLKHSLHRGVKNAKGFYVMYAALIAGAATIVLIPGSPLGLFTEGVQVLAGVLLPSATVFLLMLCNDKAVLGPWVNGRVTNAITGVVIGVLIMLSLILIAAVVFPHITARQIVMIMVACAGLVLFAGLALLARRRARATAADAAATARPAPVGPAYLSGPVGAGGARRREREARPDGAAGKENWRMPALAMLAPAPMSTGRRMGMLGMWAYLMIAMVAVVFRLVVLALGH